MKLFHYNFNTEVIVLEWKVEVAKIENSIWTSPITPTDIEVIKWDLTKKAIIKRETTNIYSEELIEKPILPTFSTYKDRRSEETLNRIIDSIDEDELVQEEVIEEKCFTFIVNGECVHREYNDGLLDDTWQLVWYAPYNEPWDFNIYTHTWGEINSFNNPTNITFSGWWIDIKLYDFIKYEKLLEKLWIDTRHDSFAYEFGVADSFNHNSILAYQSKFFIKNFSTNRLQFMTNSKIFIKNNYSLINNINNITFIREKEIETEKYELYLNKKSLWWTWATEWENDLDSNWFSSNNDFYLWNDNLEKTNPWWKINYFKIYKKKK